MLINVMSQDVCMHYRNMMIYMLAVESTDEKEAEWPLSSCKDLYCKTPKRVWKISYLYKPHNVGYIPNLQYLNIDLQTTTDIEAVEIVWMKIIDAEVVCLAYLHLFLVYHRPGSDSQSKCIIIPGNQTLQQMNQLGEQKAEQNYYQWSLSLHIVKVEVPTTNPTFIFILRKFPSTW